MSVIAERLGVVRGTVAWCLNKRTGVEWDKARKAFNDEVDSVVILAEDTVHEMISQRRDIRVASQNAQWYLERKKPAAYSKQDTLKIEGGEPIRIETKHLICIDDLNLPLDTRRILLKAIEEQEESKEENEE